MADKEDEPDAENEKHTVTWKESRKKKGGGGVLAALMESNPITAGILATTFLVVFFTVIFLVFWGPGIQRSSTQAALTTAECPGTVETRTIGARWVQINPRLHNGTYCRVTATKPQSETIAAYATGSPAFWLEDMAGNVEFVRSAGGQRMITFSRCSPDSSGNLNLGCYPAQTANR